MTLLEAYEIPQLQSQIQNIVLKDVSRINWIWDELTRLFYSNNIVVIISDNDIRNLVK